MDPYHLLFQGGQFYLLGYSHERDAVRVFRLSRIRGKVSYATKAEHDFRRPADFDPRAYANRADWQLGDERAVAEVQLSERIAWQVERHFGRYGQFTEGEGERVFVTGYSNPRGLISWVLGLGVNARLLGPEDLTTELARRLELLDEHHGDSPPQPPRGRAIPRAARRRPGSPGPRARAGGAGTRAEPTPRVLGARTPRSARSASRAW